jgi:Tol biopolymer transport system component
LSSDGRHQALIVEERLYLQQVDEDPREVQVEGPVSRVVWSPRGERLAFFAGEADRARWYVIGPDGDGMTVVGNSAFRRFSLIGWSPDAQRLAFAFLPLTYETPISVLVAPADGGEPTKVGEYPWPPGRDGGPVETPRWSLDGDKILVFGDRAYAIDASGVQPAQPVASPELEEEFGTEQHPQFIFAPDRTHFASIYQASYRSAWLVDLSTARAFPIPADATLVNGEDDIDRTAELDVRVAPNNDGYVAVGLGARLMISDAFGFNTRVIDTGQLRRTEVRWAPDGEHLLYAADNWYFVVDPLGGEPRPVASKADGATAIWSDKGDRIALVDGNADRDVTVITLDGDRERLVDADLTDGWIWPPELAWPRTFAQPDPLRDGTPSDVFIAALGEAPRNLTRTPDNHEEEPALSPDGRTIAYIRDTTELWLMDADGSGQRRLATFESVGVPEPLAWSPDGRFIAWNRFGELRIVDAATGESFEPASSGCYLYFVAWSQDSRTIYLRTQCDFEGP